VPKEGLMPKKVVLKLTKEEYKKRLAVLRRKAKRSMEILAVKIAMRQFK
jgi:hypothetical protein